MNKLLLAIAAAVLASCATPSVAPPIEIPWVTGDTRQPAKDARLTRIHFGSCINQRKSAPILDTMVGRSADLTVLLGDNVYGDVEDFSDPTVPELVSAYEMLADLPEFQRLVAASPIIATWDDHDFGDNDAGGDFPLKRSAERVFEDFWYPTQIEELHSRPGVYDAFTYGPEGQRVQVILLDTRFFRDPLQDTDQPGALGIERFMPSDDPDAQMLGEDQEAWLYRTLQKPADLRIIVSSIQLVAEGHGWEAWKTMPAARDRLGDILERAGVQSAIVVSGDRHQGGLYQAPLGDVQITELTASSINEPQREWRAQAGRTGHEPGPHRLGLPVYDENFGELDILWEAKAVALTIRGMDGEAVRTKVISFPEQREQYRQH